MEELQSEEVIEQTVEDRRWCVYMHTNKSNNKVYVGQTCKKPEHRWNNGKGYLIQKDDGTYNQPAFARAIQKYGWDGFEHIIFAENLTKDEANRMETSLIRLYKTKDPRYGYNLTYGGEGSVGFVHSEETKQKIKNSLLQVWTDEKRRIWSERQKGENNANYGKPLREETKKKISEALSGENHPMYGKHISEEQRKKRKGLWSGQKHPMYGKRHTEETKIKMSESHKGKKFSDEHKKKLSELAKNRTLPDEVKQKISSTKSRAIVQLDINGEYIQTYISAKDAHEQTGAHPDSIRRCCSGKQKTALNFCWMWADEYEKQNNNNIKQYKEN